MLRGYSSIFDQYKAILAGTAAAGPVVVLMVFSWCNDKQFFKKTKPYHKTAAFSNPSTTESGFINSSERPKRSCK